MLRRPTLAKTWKDSWTAVRDGDGGGQADVKIVVPRGKAEGQQHFLKILRQQNDPSRRSRMFREISAYRTLEHSGIPKLFDSNADAYDDLTYKLYLVTEYVPGPTLQLMVARQGRLSARSAVDLARRILRILEYSHSEDIVHRDIKPDNMILRFGALEEPVLVDFGLSFNADTDDPSKTASSEELGNRFLRLPELAPMSPAKHDPRSDVTFVAGLLLFMLTGRLPVQLVNERGQMPHQRDDVPQMLSDSTDPVLAKRLLAVFDRAFQLDPSHRWQSAAEFQVELSTVLEPRRDDASTQARWKHIEGSIRRPQAQVAVDLTRKLKSAIAMLKDVHRAVSVRTAGHFLASSTGYKGVDATQGRSEIQLGFQRPGGSPPSVWVHFTLRIIGDELVVRADDRGDSRDVFRSGLAKSDFEERDRTSVEDVLVKHLADQIE
jgi:serine/threonine-protein kinase